MKKVTLHLLIGIFLLGFGSTCWGLAQMDCEETCGACNEARLEGLSKVENALWDFYSLYQNVNTALLDQEKNRKSNLDIR